MIKIVDTFISHAYVTFAAAAVRSKISTANSEYRAAAAFPRSHTVPDTYVRVAARFFWLNLWRWQYAAAVRPLK